MLFRSIESYTGDKKLRYYGRIEEIWELKYSGEKVPMFRVRKGPRTHKLTLPPYP